MSEAIGYLIGQDAGHRLCVILLNRQIQLFGAIDQRAGRRQIYQ